MISPPYRNRFRTEPGHKYKQCIATTKRGTQCRCAQTQGQYCDQHHLARYMQWRRLCALYTMNKDMGIVPTYCIRFQKRADFKDTYGPGPHRCARSNWKNWRTFSVWPILFHTAEEADLAMSCLFTFKNYAGRKASASIGRITR